MMLENVLTNKAFVAAGAVIGSFLLVYLIIPRVRWVVTSRELNDYPDHRSAHTAATPTMAGFAFFLTLVIVVFFLKRWDVDIVGLNIVAGLSLIFTIGLKDDLVLSSPRAKLIGEIIVILFLLGSTHFQIGSLDGFLGIHTLPLLLSAVLTIVMLLTIMNAYNLIDGIDGLAAIIGMVIFSIYALIFYATDLFFYFFLCLSLIGVLLAYLHYNISEAKKIFMGDTGSLIIGFFLGVFTLKFMAMDTALLSHFAFMPENKLIVVAAVLCIPLFDMFRVIGVRLLNGQSPLYPDRNHIHHVLLDSGLSHVNAALLLGFFNYVLVIALIFLSSKFNSFLMLAILGLSFVIFLGVFYLLKRKIEKKKHLERQ